MGVNVSDIFRLIDRRSFPRKLPLELSPHSTPRAETGNHSILPKSVAIAREAIPPQFAHPIRSNLPGWYASKVRSQLNLSLPWMQPVPLVVGMKFLPITNLLFLILLGFFQSYSLFRLSVSRCLGTARLVPHFHPWVSPQPCPRSEQKLPCPLQGPHLLGSNKKLSPCEDGTWLLGKVTTLGPGLMHQTAFEKPFEESAPPFALGNPQVPRAQSGIH